ncbi:M20/M25/M40 family metallo-hydrolase [Caldivirga maquilingensis]|uniref:Putative [LysW]-lysine/[LysW]-ornithine hydrolase n=1 Tax=Caldivirga maquilingensis (strain ATCC 700844 / DSM 13496 / JCM 10307 / IC-167) TaxID=397948 RepID=A8MAC2_CALMQ|nr:M20/M25/M40 family metallo-hydrolase [Caldivirga maquilingensis]ABW02499.1 N-acetyl-ornithine/N-acetyl-lysine deacetylase [Caldivirga maquilingensis IC-167]
MALSSGDVKELLINLLKIYSPSGEERGIAEFISSFLKQHGAEAWIDEAGNVLAVKGSGERVLWLHAHMDTVPGFIEVRGEGDLVYGRGAVDDKGPLTSMITAFLNSKPEVTLVLTLVTREESDSLGSLSLIKSSLPKPDGVIVGEPTNMHIAYSYRGSARVEVKCLGQGGHTAGPGVEDNPILKVYSAFNTVVGKLGNGQSTESYTVTPTVINCGDHPSKVPTECTMTVNVRIPLNSSCMELSKVIEGIECVKIIDCTDPITVNVNNPVVRSLVRASLRNNVKPILSKKLGTSDMAILAKLTLNLAAYGPGDPTLSHGPVEYININDVLLASNILINVVNEFGRISMQR